jgi:hypothetical protein
VINKRPVITTSVVVTDVSGEEGKFSLDGHGFQYHKHESKEKGFHDEDKIKAVYFPECEQLLKDV